MVPAGMRNIHDNKVSGQMATNSSNHNSSDDYMGMVHRSMGSGVRHTRSASRHTRLIRPCLHYTGYSILDAGVVEQWLRQSDHPGSIPEPHVVSLLSLRIKESAKYQSRKAANAFECILE